MGGFLVVRDDDTLRDRLGEALFDDGDIDAVLAVLRDVGTPATTETAPIPPAEDVYDPVTEWRTAT